MHSIVYELDRRRLALVFFGAPTVALPTVYVACLMLSRNFGNAVFVLTIVTCFGWVFLNLNDRSGSRSGVVRSVLSRRSESGSGVLAPVRSPRVEQLQRTAYVLVALTGTVVVGWMVLLAS